MLLVVLVVESIGAVTGRLVAVEVVVVVLDGREDPGNKEEFSNYNVISINMYRVVVVEMNLLLLALLVALLLPPRSC